MLLGALLVMTVGQTSAHAAAFVDAARDPTRGGSGRLLVVRDGLADLSEAESLPSPGNPETSQTKSDQSGGARGIRIGAEALAGAAMLVGAPLVGLLAAQGCVGFMCDAGGLAVGGLVGVVLTPFVIAGVGSLLGGEGGVGTTWLGFLAGASTAGLAFLCVRLVVQPAGDLELALYVAGFALPLLGALVGFELSHSLATSDVIRLGATPLPGGALLAVAGTF